MSAGDERQFDICIVTWRTRELLRRCLRAVADEPGVARLIVVDNASGDGTPEMVRAEFPETELIVNEENLGFAEGNNQAMRAGTARFVLLLNPDTEMRPGALATLLARFEERDEVAAVAPQLILPSGEIQRSCRSFPRPGAVLLEALGLWRVMPGSKVLGGYRMTSWDHDSRREVEQPMASALALRREALSQVGLFDPSFPLYFNDVDLCYRLREAGWRVVFEPEAKALHHHGQSTRQVRAAAVMESHRSLIRFYRKHYRGRTFPPAYWLVVSAAWLTMWPRALISWIAQLLRPASD